MGKFKKTSLASTFRETNNLMPITTGAIRKQKSNSRKSASQHELCSRPPNVRLCLASPVGRIILEACPAGLHCLTMADAESERPCIRLKSGQSEASLELVSIIDQSGTAACPADSPAQQTLAWLKAYFSQAGSISGSDLPPLPTLCATRAAPPGSFRYRVWRALAASVPPGVTVSYQQLASLAGANPGAARAVGSAMRANPVPLLVPCHRVVRTDGSPGHFAGGKADATKLWLLKREKSAKTVV